MKPLLNLQQLSRAKAGLACEAALADASSGAQNPGALCCSNTVMGVRGRGVLAPVMNWAWSAVLLCSFFAATVQAHDPGLSIATASLANGELSIRLAMARVDVERLVNLDANLDGHVTDAEFQGAQPQLQDLCRKAFTVSCGRGPLRLAKVSTQRDDQEGVHFQLSFLDLPAGNLEVRSGLLDSMPRGHRQFVSVRDAKGNLLSEQMLDVNHASLTLNCVAESEPVRRHPIREFLDMGVMHIATGYDHLLFLLGLLLVGGSIRSALQIITSFTCAHSITLALDTLNVIHISSRIIEPLIAASIIYVGLENLARPEAKGRWRLTFVFGLIHGCGFASALQELGVGSNGLGIVTPLVSFNLGVELGQMTLAALVLPIIWKFRSSPALVHRLAPVGSALIVVAGTLWLVQRTLF